MPDPRPLPPGTWPSVTCLCPTYGRFERLRDAVACFLLQDYPGPAELLILNDAPTEIQVAPGERCSGGTRSGASAVCGTGALACGRPWGSGSVRVVNSAARYANLGAKRQALLEAAQTPLVAHWDDDDLYLPWHLSAAVAALEGRAPARPAVAGMVEGRAPTRPPFSCAKSRCGWWALGRREIWELQGGVHHNQFEGQMVFLRDRAIDLGGYPGKMSGQAADLLAAFGRAGELNLYRPADEDVSYIYRWADGGGHVSACPGEGAKRQAEWLRRNQDFGLDGKGQPQPLIPSGNPVLWARAQLAGQFRIFLEQLQPRLTPEGWQKVSDRIHTALGMAPHDTQAGPGAQEERLLTRRPGGG